MQKRVKIDSDLQNLRADADLFRNVVTPRKSCIGHELPGDDRRDGFQPGDFFEELGTDLRMVPVHRLFRRIQFLAGIQLIQSIRRQGDAPYLGH
ncbi:MAG: hypothetical protein ACD_75C00883G0002 [uncultured bacterium]|nr:MAG: hypothetical protein ACD_75C00883G0002 [uncultured bacterium]